MNLWRFLSWNQLVKKTRNMILLTEFFKKINSQDLNVEGALFAFCIFGIENLKKCNSVLLFLK